MAADRPDDEDPARALGRALRALQRRSGCTLRSLETSVRISDSSLSRYFRGTTVPPWATVRDLCKALGGDPADFRLLWEAADRSQRRPVQGNGPGQAEAPEAPEAGDTPSGNAPSETPRRRLSVRGGRTVWALAGTVLGLVLGAASTALVQSWSPSSGDEDAPASAHGPTAASDVHRIFVSRATGACLDDSLDMGTRSYACNGMSYQRWTVRTTADGSVQLRNHATGECLDHHPGGLRTVACGPSATQRWNVTAGDDEAVEIRSTTTRRCLDDSAGGVQVLSCDRTTRQKWA
ncbi:helix-turn-helix domain-containing protein [Streptomyces sp. NPDC056222]|uniref:helix-turn-helix domain-containing protein n=1 Tax=Streptomyces sp. NPDC056222 TaxID=3345749 RepID=UPI0035E27C41